MNLYVPVLVAVTTGIRRGELLGLRWRDLDLTACTLTVNQAMQRTKGELEFKSPKTKTSRRTITLPAATVEALQAHDKVQLEERMKLGLGRDPHGLEFTRADGKPLDPDSLSKAFERLVLKAKVTPITLHGLRHTHISHLLMDGVHVKVVSERGWPCQRQHHPQHLRGLHPQHAGGRCRAGERLAPLVSENSWVRNGCGIEI
jgi:integrase